MLFDLVQRVRQEFLRDTDGPEEDYLWKSPSIVNALNEAQKEVARRCLLLKDASSSVCFLTLAADDTGNFPQSLSLSSKVLRVRFVRFPRSTGGYRPLVRTTVDKLNARHHAGGSHDPVGGYSGYGESGGFDWLGKKGEVTRFLTDFETKKLTFDRQPTSGGTVNVGVYRLPLNDLSWSTAKTTAPEIQEHDIVLIYGALKHLYLLEDEGTYDVQRAKFWEDKFDREVGKRIPREEAEENPQETVCRAEVW